MRVFLGSPPRRLLQEALRALGEPSPLLVLPTGAPHLPLPLPTAEWHSFWQSVVGQPRLTSITSAHLAACAEVCQRSLSDEDYFGKVRHLPRFHRQLMVRWVEWRQDGLTPEQLEQAAYTVVQPPFDAIAGIDSPALRAEWLRKVNELCRLWREWAQRLQDRHLPDPGAGWWEGVAVVQQGRAQLPPRLLLWGFHDLHAVDIALLRAAERAGCEVSLALLHDPAQLERFTPTQTLLARLQSEVSDLADWSELSDIVSEEQPAAVVLSAADSLREMEAVARQILSHLRQGVAPEQMLLFLRHPAEAAERLSIVLERYGIPFALEAQLPLSRSPFVRVLMDALHLLLGNGMGYDWLAWLQNPYLGLPRAISYRLMSLSRRTYPANEWLSEAQRRLGQEPSFASLFALLTGLRERLRSPSPDMHMVLSVLIQWLAPAISDAFTAFGAGLQARNDLSAAGVLLDVARAYAPLLQRMPPSAAVAYLARLCDAELYPHSWGQTGVRVLPLEQAGLAQAEIVFVMELMEGMLPRRHPDDPFLRESERHALRAVLAAQGVYLPLRSERQRLEPLWFYEAITAATQHLYLSYPRTIENGETVPSSYLQTLPMTAETRFYRLEELVPPESERLHPYDRALTHAIEAGECYEGDALQDRLMLPRTRQRVVDIDRAFSVSELETLARCPFQYLFRHRLRVRIPRRGLHLTQIGSVLHAALRHTYRQAYHLPPDSPEWAHALLDSLRCVADAETLDLSHWQLQVLHAYATRLLQLFAQREPRYRQQFGTEPRLFEWAFGMPPLADLSDELDLSAVPVPPDLSERFDPDSVPGAYRLPLGEGHTMRLCGVVDRVDFSTDGKVAIVTDYKLTRSPSRSEIEAGLAFQPLIYALTIQACYKPERIVIAFDELTHGRRVRIVPYDEALIRRFRAGEWEGSPHEVMMVVPQRRMEQAIENLRAELRHLLELLQQATVAPTPGEHCRVCAFRDLCRKAPFR
ncbi:ATP-dependent helicase/deoxyribonuclease subunit B [bacterium HR15]|nr:ATP-dependent helicase/deoxyribonuclease subunit B [bacterium HR15]